MRGMPGTPTTWLSDEEREPVMATLDHIYDIEKARKYLNVLLWAFLFLNILPLKDSQEFFKAVFPDYNWGRGLFCSFNNLL